MTLFNGHRTTLVCPEKYHYIYYLYFIFQQQWYGTFSSRASDNTKIKYFSTKKSSYLVKNNFFFSYEFILKTKMTIKIIMICHLALLNISKKIFFQNLLLNCSKNFSQLTIFWPINWNIFKMGEIFGSSKFQNIVLPQPWISSYHYAMIRKKNWHTSIKIKYFWE